MSAPRIWILAIAAYGAALAVLVLDRSLLAGFGAATALLAGFALVAPIPVRRALASPAFILGGLTVVMWIRAGTPLL